MSAEAQLAVVGVDPEGPPLLVGILMASASDMEAMTAAATEASEKRAIGHEVRVLSAHRQPDEVAEYARNARARGIRVLIAGAGLSAALPASAIRN